MLCLIPGEVRAEWTLYKRIVHGAGPERWEQRSRQSRNNGTPRDSSRRAGVQMKQCDVARAREGWHPCINLMELE
jgi:hypothetical protein